MAHKDLPKYNHVDLLFPGKYLKAGDLRGRDIVVTIDDIDPRHDLKTKEGEEKRPLVTFHAAKKGLVLNKTNAKIIAGLYGADVLGWIGQKVTLYAAEVSAFGETVEAVRIRKQRPVSPRTQQREQPPPIPDEAKADELPPHDPDTGEVTNEPAEVPTSYGGERPPAGTNQDYDFGPGGWGANEEPGNGEPEEEPTDPEQQNMGGAGF